MRNRTLFKIAVISFTILSLCTSLYKNTIVTQDNFPQVITKEVSIKNFQKQGDVSNTVAIATPLIAILALYFSYYKYKNDYTIREKAPILSVKEVNINGLQNEIDRISVIICNDGKRIAHFRRACDYTFNTANNTVKVNLTDTEIEIKPDGVIPIVFNQPKATTRNPNVYYCVKIWYNDQEIKNTEARLLFFKLKIIKNQVQLSTVPNELLKTFKSQIKGYEDSSLSNEHAFTSKKSGIIYSEE